MVPILAVTNRGGAGTSGRISGTKLWALKRGAPFWIGWATYAAVASLATMLEIGDELKILGGLKIATPRWQAWTNGWSSVIALVVLYPAIRAVAARTRPGRTPLRTVVALQTGAALSFWVLHFGGYSLVRLAVYPLFGASYVWQGDSILYEGPRDLSAYVVLVAIMWLAMALWERRPAPATLGEAAQAHFDIRDNARLIRVLVGDIIAVGSAGNYVEFHLADGRKPLMRATLATIEARLKPQGFARTHRSWLANTRRIAEITPTGSGDFTLSLQGGLQIPLSRRFREDLETSKR
jgi:hypothetical protein